MPVGLRRCDPQTLEILWADGTVKRYDSRDLRLACPCAMCVDEMTGKKTLERKAIPDDIAPRVISSVGRYAITVQWSDGHSTGIYHFDGLRKWGVSEPP